MKFLSIYNNKIFINKKILNVSNMILLRFYNYFDYLKIDLILHFTIKYTIKKLHNFILYEIIFKKKC